MSVITLSDAELSLLGSVDKPAVLNILDQTFDTIIHMEGVTVEEYEGVGRQRDITYRKVYSSRPTLDRNGRVVESFNARFKRPGTHVQISFGFSHAWQRFQDAIADYRLMSDRTKAALLRMQDVIDGKCNRANVIALGKWLDGDAKSYCIDRHVGEFIGKSLNHTSWKQIKPEQVFQLLEATS